MAQRYYSGNGQTNSASTAVYYQPSQAGVPSSPQVLQRKAIAFIEVALENLPNRPRTTAAQLPSGEVIALNGLHKILDQYGEVVLFEINTVVGFVHENVYLLRHGAKELVFEFRKSDRSRVEMIDNFHHKLIAQKAQKGWRLTDAGNNATKAQFSGGLLAWVGEEDEVFWFAVGTILNRIFGTEYTFSGSTSIPTPKQQSQTTTMQPQPQPQQRQVALSQPTQPQKTQTYRVKYYKDTWRGNADSYEPTECDQPLRSQYPSNFSEFPFPSPKVPTWMPPRVRVVRPKSYLHGYQPSPFVTSQPQLRVPMATQYVSMLQQQNE